MAIIRGRPHRRAVLQDREYEQPEASLDYIDILKHLPKFS